MKKKILYIIAFLLPIFSSCIKEDKILFTDTIFEWDAATFNANGPGVTYPILTRVAGYGRAAVSTDPIITRTVGSIKFRINLVGPQRSAPTTVNYTATGTANTTSGSIAAVAGIHFNTSGTVIIPPNSSFGEAQVDVLNTGVSSAVPADVVLTITATGDVRPSENKKSLGIRFNQN